MPNAPMASTPAGENVVEREPTRTCEEKRERDDQVQDRLFHGPERVRAVHVDERHHHRKPEGYGGEPRPEPERQEQAAHELAHDGERDAGGRSDVKWIGEL